MPDSRQAMLAAAKDDFWALRGTAIQAHAELEQSLCLAFASWGEIKHDVASVIFFKITSARARDGVMEKLLKKKHGSVYSVFWKSAGKHIAHLSELRNKIVHWNAIVVLTKTGDFSRVQLELPNFWDNDDSSPVLTSEDLFGFTKRCSFVSLSCSMFIALTGNNSSDQSEDNDKTWNDIFQQELIYPPPNTHPLYQSFAERESQPQSSRRMVIPGTFRTES